MSVYPAYQRTWKPFNPILGETYEMVKHNGITFLAEQVSFAFFKSIFPLCDFEVPSGLLFVVELHLHSLGFIQNCYDQNVGLSCMTGEPPSANEFCSCRE